MTQLALIGVIGPGEGVSKPEMALAEEVGFLLASRAAVVVTGGLGGIMEAACRGARRAKGLTLGYLPGSDAALANDFVQIAIPTGLGETRNTLVVNSSRALISIGLSWGTLSELAFAIRVGISCFSLTPTYIDAAAGGLEDRIVTVASAAEAVDRALGSAEEGMRS